ncbi:MAG: hypothetical protein KIT27_10220, partial [Legionellales bacterium]|nr:hypothetical protein [Legionellales bacterium]
FVQYHNYLMSRPMSAKSVYSVIKKLNLNTVQFYKDMHSKWVLMQIESGLSLLRKYHSGTPLIMIYPSNQSNHVSIFRGETNLRQLVSAIKEDDK